MSVGDVAHVLRGGPDRRTGLPDTEPAISQSGDVGQDSSSCADAILNKAGPEITLITKCGSTGHMSKKIFLDEHGALHSDGSHCLMVQGAAARMPAATAEDLAKILAACSSDNAIALGSLKRGLPNSVRVTVPAKLKDQPGAITRSREFIDYRLGIPAWCLIDFDAKGMPADVVARIDGAGGMWNALLTVAPSLLRAARVSRASTSAGLFRSDTGESLAGNSGMHHYVLVSDGGDIDRFLKDLHDRCWLHGFGWHMIGGAGQLLERSLVDRMVGYGERAVFRGRTLYCAATATGSGQAHPRSG